MSATQMSSISPVSELLPDVSIGLPSGYLRCQSLTLSVDLNKNNRSFRFIRSFRFYFYVCLQV